MTGRLAVAALRDRAALGAIVPAWWDLWHASATATPFQSPAWLLPWWDTFTPGELFVVIVRDDDRLLALAPFYIETGAMGRRVLPIGIAASDYLDILVVETDALEILASHVASTADGWDEWELSELAPRAAGLLFPCPTDCSDKVETTIPCPVLPVPAAAEGLRQAISSRQWRSLVGARNRAARRGSVAIIDGRTDPIGFLDELVRLHQSRWERVGGTGVFSDPRMRAFQTKALPQLCAAGLARLYLLNLAGRVSAAYYGFACRGRASIYLSGYDLRDKFESPGTLLIGHAIDQALQEGAVEFHFLRGAESYKYDWGAVDRFNSRRVLRRRAA